MNQYMLNIIMKYMIVVLNTRNYNLELSMIDEYNTFNDFKYMRDKIGNCSDHDIHK